MNTHFPVNENQILERFLLTMAGGVHIRRHQKNKLSEVVRLFSVNGCKSILWEKPQALKLLQERRKLRRENREHEEVQGVNNRFSGDIAIEHIDDRSIFDCCVTGI